MGRLRYAQKFLLIGLVLVAPLGYVVKSYLDQQSTQIDFSAKERTGVVYVKPATELLARIVAARAAAVQLGAHSAGSDALSAARTQLDAAVAHLDGTDQAVGGTLALRPEWAALRAQLRALPATDSSTPQQILDAYDKATAGALKLIVDAGNNSNLILDPDLDSFYVMDSVINRLPSLLDLAGQAGDLQTAITASGQTTLVKRIDLAVLKGNIGTTVANADANYVTAFKNTKDGALAQQLRQPLTALDGALGAVTDNLTAAVQGSLDGGTATSRGASAAAAAMALDRASLPALDHLLAARIDKFTAAKTRVELIALLGVLAALYLFVGFYFSVRRSQRAILERLRVLETDCASDLLRGSTRSRQATSPSI